MAAIHHSYLVFIAAWILSTSAELIQFTGPLTRLQMKGEDSVSPQEFSVSEWSLGLKISGASGAASV